MLDIIETEGVSSDDVTGCLPEEFDFEDRCGQIVTLHQAMDGESIVNIWSHTLRFIHRTH